MTASADQMSPASAADLAIWHQEMAADAYARSRSFRIDRNLTGAKGWQQNGAYHSREVRRLTALARAGAQ